MPKEVTGIYWKKVVIYWYCFVVADKKLFKRIMRFEVDYHLFDQIFFFLKIWLISFSCFLFYFEKNTTWNFAQSATQKLKTNYATASYLSNDREKDAYVLELLASECSTMLFDQHN